MGTDAKTQELRDLAGLAKKLREYAVQTDDAHYIAMFLATAETLEARAAAMDQGATPRADVSPPPDLHT